MKKPLNIITLILFLCAVNIAFFCGGRLYAGDTAEDSRDDYPEAYTFTQKGNFEIGGVAGTPSGLNARYWITDSFGLDLSAGTVLKGDFYYSADLLYEFYDLYRAGGWRLRFFTGFGSMGGFRNNDAYRDIRVPVGVSMPFLRYPFSLSAFVAPAWEILPEKKAAIDFGIAARFNFGLSSRIRDREAELKWRIITIKKNYDQVKAKLDKTGKELDGAINELNKTRGDLGSTRGQLDKTIGSLTAAKGELDETRTELSTARQKLDTTIGELESTRGRLGQATREMHSMKKDLDNAKARLDEAHMELARTRKVLDDREAELKNKQAEMDRTRAILKTEMEGKEKAAEEKRLASKQEELDHKIQKYKQERAAWEKQSRKQKEKRLSFRTKCEARRGIINEEGYCDCREHEQWNTDRSACECVKGYRLNARTNRCEPCRIINYFGACTNGCANDERMTPLGKGPHAYVCVKKCRKSNETWSERKGSCVCKDGYYREPGGDCVPRR